MLCSTDCSSTVGEKGSLDGWRLPRHPLPLNPTTKANLSWWSTRNCKTRSWYTLNQLPTYIVDDWDTNIEISRCVASLSNNSVQFLSWLYHNWSMELSDLQIVWLKHSPYTLQVYNYQTCALDQWVAWTGQQHYVLILNPCIYNNQI